MVRMDRREQMRGWLERRERLGLTFRELSEETGIPVGTLAFWAWKLRQERGAAAPAHGSASTFVELVPTPSEERGARLEIVLRGERRVLIVGDVEEERLVRVVRALERC